MRCRELGREEALAWLETHGLPTRYHFGKYKGCGLLSVARLGGPGISYVKDFMARTQGFFHCNNPAPPSAMATPEARWNRGRARHGAMDLLKALYALRLVRRVRDEQGRRRWAVDVLREHYATRTA